MIPSAEIILRTCTRTNVMPGGWQRYVPFEKRELVLGCVRSLILSAEAAKSVADIGFTILDDGSDPGALDIIMTWLKLAALPARLEQLGGVGFNKSALRQFELSKNSKADFVYSVEDDYLHSLEAMTAMVRDILGFESNLGGSLTAIHPFDDPFTYYHHEKMASSKVVLGSDRHWRTNTFSTNTIFTRPAVFQQHWQVFAKLANEYGINTTTEHTTINHLWNNGVDRQGPVYLMTPIPSLALHLSYNNQPPFMDWKKWWPEIEVNP